MSALYGRYSTVDIVAPYVFHLVKREGILYMKLITKDLKLSPTDKLPKKINDPKELITKITKKVTINSKATNLNDTFQWISLAEKILKRCSDFDEKLIMNLKIELASVLIDSSFYSKAKKLLKDSIKICSKQSKNKKKLASCYYNMAMALRFLGDYENAKINILKAMEACKNHSSYHSEYASILYCLDKNDEAEEKFKKAVKISTGKNGKKHIKTASILFSYSLFLASKGKTDLAIKNMNNVYPIFKKSLGEEHLYTVRIGGHISNFLFIEKKYAEAFEKMKVNFSICKKVLGDDNVETQICKTNCAVMLIKMKKYSDAIDYIDIPFVFTDGKENLILLSYNSAFMEAPESFFSITGSTASKILRTIEAKNILVVKNKILAKNLIHDCNLLETIPEKYYKTIAEVISKYYKPVDSRRKFYALIRKDFK